MMNIYKISQEEKTGYDTYSDAVVVAPDEETARKVYPKEGGRSYDSSEVEFIPFKFEYEFDELYDWTNDPSLVKVELIGQAVDEFDKIKIICASFHAG